MEKTTKSIKPDDKIGQLERYSAADVAWVELGDYILGEGSKKAVDVLKGLEGDTFLKHFTNIAEFVKPRLTRVDSKTEQQVVINIKTENVLPEVKKREVIEGEVVENEVLPVSVVTEESP